MATRDRINDTQHARRDLISQLPIEVRERILECLSTRDAARTAVLSTLWKDVWLQHGRLVFDRDFFQSIQKYVSDNNSMSVANIINNILLLHGGPVKKFALHIYLEPRLKQSDVERWCHFLSRNGIEELTLDFFYLGSMFKMPFCIFSCPTIKRLRLNGLLLDFPANASSIFPGITSLVFENVVLKWSVNGVSSRIPNLEKLAFHGYCEGMDKFKISAPKLESLSCIDSYYGFEPRWFAIHLNQIKTLCLSGSFSLLEYVAAAVLISPTAINLQVMKLYDLSFGCGKQIATAMKLLQKSPNLCELDITAATTWSEDEEGTLRLLEDPDRYFINQDMKMLRTVKIECFNGSRLQILFVKSVFSKCPALERVIIHPCNITDALMEMKILRELARFPRASRNAQLVFMEHKSIYSLVGYNVGGILSAA